MAPANDRRQIFGWTMYDWANSGFQTTVLTVFAGPYLTALVQHAVGENGRVVGRGALLVTAKSFYPYCVGLSVFLQVVLLPLVGAITDYADLKKRALALVCYIGSSIGCLLFFVTE